MLPVIVFVRFAWTCFTCRFGEKDEKHGKKSKEEKQNKKTKPSVVHTKKLSGERRQRRTSQTRAHSFPYSFPFWSTCILNYKKIITMLIKMMIIVVMKMTIVTIIIITVNYNNSNINGRFLSLLITTEPGFLVAFIITGVINSAVLSIRAYRKSPSFY